MLTTTQLVVPVTDYSPKQEEAHCIEQSNPVATTKAALAVPLCSRLPSLGSNQPIYTGAGAQYKRLPSHAKPQ
jgi:hypothetical protein